MNMARLAAGRSHERALRIFNHVKVSVNPVSLRNMSSKQVNVNGAIMNYVDTGNGTAKHKEDAVVFLHGNPTSSYLWRNIIPHVKDLTRCLAPDLIGMGKSSKVPGIKYTFMEHYSYLSKWMESVDLPEKVNLVIHDWGSALGFHWANEHRDRVKSISFMESLVAPLPWDAFPDVARNIFQAFRSPAGEELVLKKNLFVTQLLPKSVMRELTEEEMHVYLEPFQKEEDRLPTLTWPREIPVLNDGPENVVEIARNYSEYLSTSTNLPKLYIDADPGFFSSTIKKIVTDWPNQRVVTVPGLHFLQEDSPDQIGKAIRSFLEKDVL
uniref:AB hydrolase-1 domain-containing protein n=1 Tax=Ciona savignyi TaxID=51511 RepID=H2ZJI4_CIOSA